MGFSGKNTGVGCHFLLQEIFQGIEPRSHALKADALPSEHPVSFNCYRGTAAATAKSFQSCPTLCDPMDCSLPGSSVHGIFRQEYWSGMPFPSPGHLPNPGMEPRSPTLQVDSLPAEPPGKPKSERESHSIMSDSLRHHGLYSPWNFPG